LENIIYSSLTLSICNRAQVICLKNTHEHEGAQCLSSSADNYFRQIKSAHVITNISHCLCRPIAYYGWPKAAQVSLNLLYRQPAQLRVLIWTDKNRKILWRSRKVDFTIVSWLLATLFKKCFTQSNKDLKALCKAIISWLTNNWAWSFIKTKQNARKLLSRLKLQINISVGRKNVYLT